MTDTLPNVDLFPEQLKRFCVLCGNSPNDITKEHVIPRWLVEMTGDPHRQIPLSVDKTTWTANVQSADQYVFPACKECNGRFATLEAQAKSVMVALLARTSVTEHELSTLLDWLDKFRISLWAADMMRNRATVSVERKFHAESRIGQKDRCCLILRTDDTTTGFSISGVSSASFHFTPSCFSLAVNDLYFVNLSYDFLFMHRLGFPRYVDRSLNREGLMGGAFKSGRGSVRLPLLQRRMPLSHVGIFQPCIPTMTDEATRSEYFNSPYVRENLLENGLHGRIFNELGQRWFTTANRTNLSLDALPPYPRQFLHCAVPIIVHLYQDMLDSMFPSIDTWDRESRQNVRRLRATARRFNATAVKHFTERVAGFRNHPDAAVHQAAIAILTESRRLDSSKRCRQNSAEAEE